MFMMIDVGLKLNQDINNLIIDLDLPKTIEGNIYEQYIGNLEVKPERLEYVTRQIYIYKDLLPYDLSTVDMDTLDRVRNQLINLPNRNVRKYKDIDTLKLIKMDIEPKDKVGISTVKNGLVLLNSFIKYAYQRNRIDKEYKVSMPKSNLSDRNERQALDVDAISKLLKGCRTAKLRLGYTLLYLTGLRPSEVSKCKVTMVDGVKCFDLTDTTVSLKTKGSYRLIPVHSSIDNPEEILENYKSLTKSIMRTGFKGKGTPYSLRHSFATHLAANGVEPHLISELMGHSHKSMTLDRYVKSFPIELLKKAIDTL